MKQVHVYIRGDVIGVGFRAWTKIQAKLINIEGWVKNTKNQSVEAMIQGNEKDIDRMIILLKTGPPSSRVDKIETSFEEPEEIFKDFEIRR